MRHVGVERRAKERQAAGHGRLHVGTKAERSPRHFRHAGKATIEFDRVERVAVAAGEVHHRLEHGVLRVTFEKLVADRDSRAALPPMRRPRCEQAMLGNAGGARLGQAGHQDRAAHVDGRIGHHQLGIGPGDQPVVRRWRCDLFRREAPLQPGVRVLRRRRWNRSTTTGRIPPSPRAGSGPNARRTPLRRTDRP